MLKDTKRLTLKKTHEGTSPLNKTNGLVIFIVNNIASQIYAEVKEKRNYNANNM
ncbi:hypothetical protein H311_00433 [Anncaliia algerae PRA109]|nr:hypothetical protein H311_00433 [Anncaliia algerae PRA109]